jgi:nucleotide-binding universal stress UspA family protein
MTSVQTILHPTDFSPCADKAFQAACSLARGCGAQVIVLHVLEPVRLPAEWLTVELFGPPKRDRWETLRRLRMREPDVPIEPVMRKGAPAAVILDLVREVPCDLIVMGVPGQAAEGLSGLSDVAEEVAGRAPCPVMTLTVPRRFTPATPRRHPTDT